jgi:hypothetical protein
VKFKLDENIGRRGRELLEAAGHDVMTVREQDLRGRCRRATVQDLCRRTQI